MARRYLISQECYALSDALLDELEFKFKILVAEHGVIVLLHIRSGTFGICLSNCSQRVGCGG